jgi:hypothetical protein
VLSVFGTKDRDMESRPRTEERANTKAQQIVTLVVAVALPLFVVALIYFTQFKQLNDSDVMDMAQIARNVSAGRGFVTSAVRPLSTTYVRDVQHMPDMVHAPLYPYVMAMVFGASASDKKVFATSALFFLLTLPVLWALAKGMFNRRVAQLSVLAFITSMFMMNMLVGAGSGTMGAFLFTALCLVLFRFAQRAAEPGEDRLANRRALMLAAGAGALMALCYLTDNMLIFAFLPVAGFVYLAGGRFRKPGLGAFLVAFGILALPWMLFHNQALTGHALFGMRSLEIGMGTTAHPAMALYRTTVPQTLLGVLQDVKGELFRKVVQGLATAYQSFPAMGQPYLMPFFLVGLFYSFRRTGVNALRGMIIAAFLCVVIFGSLYLFSMSTIAAFVPVFLAFAAAYFIRLLTDSRAPALVSKAVTVAAVVLLALPLLTMMVLTRAPQVTAREIESDLGRRVQASTPILTDRAFEIAWYGNRTTVWLPNTEKDVENQNKVIDLKAMFLSSNLHPSQRTAENFDDWRVLYGNGYNAAVQGKFARMSSGPFKGFSLYRDMTRDDVIKYLQNGALLFTRPGGTRLPAGG